jgi:hypothetical protein
VVRVLNSLIQPQLAGNAALLTQWMTAKRFVGKTTPVPATTFQAAAIGTNAVQALSSSTTTAPSIAPVAAPTPAPAEPETAAAA